MSEADDSDATRRIEDRILRRAAVKRRRLGGAALVVVLGAAGTAAWLLRDPLPHFLERRSTIASVVVGAHTVDGRYVLTPLRVIGTSGLAVDMVVRRAIADSGKRLPLAIILGGPYAAAEAARMIGDTRGVVVAAVSYPFTGNPHPDAPTFLREIPKIRGAFLDTPPAVMLALDHLLGEPDVDRSRVEAVGVSLGAPFVCIVGAVDSRITRVWAVHGSGGSYMPLEANMRRTIPFAPVRVVAAAIANMIISGPRLDPTRWVGRIAPRSFVMINATDDERLPRSAVEALYQAAREPKEQLWMTGMHVHGDSATISRIAEIVTPRIRASAPR